MSQLGVLAFRHRLKASVCGIGVGAAPLNLPLFWLFVGAENGEGSSLELENRVADVEARCSSFCYQMNLSFNKMPELHVLRERTSKTDTHEFSLGGGDLL